MKIVKKLNIIDSNYSISQKKFLRTDIIIVSILLNLVLSSFIFVSVNNPEITAKVFTSDTLRFTKTDTFIMEVPVIYREKDLVELPRDIAKQNIAKSANNPGCIRPGNPKIDKYAIGYVTGKHGKYLRFATKEHGYRALSAWIDEFCKRNPKCTMHQLISTFAPDSENNTAHYANSIMSGTSLNMNSNAKAILSNKAQLMKVISKIEGFI